MSDENNPVVRYSSFWPQFILMIGLLIWCVYQIYAVNSQRIAINQQSDALTSLLDPANAARKRLYALAQDLIQLSAKDSYAAQIVKEANIRINNPGANTNSTETPAPSQ